MQPPVLGDRGHTGVGHPNLGNSSGHLPVTGADTTAMSYILKTPKTSMCEVQHVILHPHLWNHRITESQNSRGWKGPLWVI